MLVRQFKLRRAVRNVAGGYGFHELILLRFEMLEKCLAVFIHGKGFIAFVGGNAIAAFNGFGLDRLTIGVLLGLFQAL